MWAPIILALVQLIGPFLWKAFLAWLEKRLQAKAATMPAPMEGPWSEKLNQLTLLHAVQADLWWFQFGKRIAMAQVIDLVRTGRKPVGLIG